MSLALAILLTALPWSAPRQNAAQPPSKEKLKDEVQKLQAPSQSNEAYKNLLELGAHDKATVAFLAAALPPIVAKGPKEDLAPWENSVRLAARLQLAETCESLGKWVGFEDSQEYTNSQIFQLNLNPAAKAISQVGEPCVPALASILSKGNERDRYFTVITLDKIHSPAAMAALSNHVLSEPDPVTQRLMQHSIARHKSAPAVPHD